MSPFTSLFTFCELMPKEKFHCMRLIKLCDNMAMLKHQLYPIKFEVSWKIWSKLETVTSAEQRWFSRHPSSAHYPVKHDCVIALQRAQASASAAEFPTSYALLPRRKCYLSAFIFFHGLIFQPSSRRRY